MRTLFSLLLVPLLLTMTGCTTDDKTLGLDSSRPSAQPQRTKYRTFISDEELETQKALALIEANKSVELSRIEAQRRLKELELQREKELALLREKERLAALEHRQAMERYMLLGGMLLLILLGAALLWYFDRRRKDKLRAYEDNLKKYFHQKENEARLKIAEKILDTVAKEGLPVEQKAKLIEALHGPMKPPNETKEEEAPALPETPNETPDEAIDIEPEEEKPDETRPRD
ncbi:hypothetical protein [Hydrogenimonas sp.]